MDFGERWRNRESSRPIHKPAHSSDVHSSNAFGKRLGPVELRSHRPLTAPVDESQLIAGLLRPGQRQTFVEIVRPVESRGIGWDRPLTGRIDEADFDVVAAALSGS